MAELGAAARATVGKSRVAGSADVKMTGILLGVVVVAAVIALACLASGQVPRKLYWQRAVTEAEGPAQDFQAHLATAAELLVKPVSVPVVYPSRTAPGITTTMHRGFATSRYAVADPEIRGGGPRGVPW